MKHAALAAAAYSWKNFYIYKVLMSIKVSFLRGRRGRQAGSSERREGRRRRRKKSRRRRRRKKRKSWCGRRRKRKKEGERGDLISN